MNKAGSKFNKIEGRNWVRISDYCRPMSTVSVQRYDQLEESAMAAATTET